MLRSHMKKGIHVPKYKSVGSTNGQRNTTRFELSRALIKCSFPCYLKFKPQLEVLADLL